MNEENYKELYTEFIHNVTDIELIDHLVELRETIDEFEKELEFMKLQLCRSQNTVYEYSKHCGELSKESIEIIYEEIKKHRKYK